MSISMVIIGMGLGQLMQTLTLAAQNAVKPQDIGVATSSTMFFRQMGGTLGVAIFISILFNNLKDAIKAAFGNSAVQDGILQAAQDTSLPKDQFGMAQGLAMVVKDPTLLDKATSKMDISGDSSFLTGLDERLARPFLMGFADSAVVVFEWAAAVVAVAFVMSWFIKVAPLRDKSAAAESAAASSAH
jgi:hypothetical protein